ncbi:MAG: hypothetical protein K8J31_15560 [Anaerolineae bacterium]|jgi:hypothetical protein|nr:hypothetical protein [Anaerolineae bacterium]
MNNLGPFSAPQLEQVNTLIDHITRQFKLFTPAQRTACITLWTLIARTAAPVTQTTLRRELIDDSTLKALVDAGVIWYDSDLKAVLQCPPFSALNTRHQVKAFGWNRSFVCNFLSTPLAVLLYGPNTWLQVQSTCRRSGDELVFSVMLDDHRTLHTRTSEDAANWRISIQIPTADAPLPGRYRTCPEANVFHSLADLETYYHYYPDAATVVYTFDEAIAFSSHLLRAYDPLYAE